MIRNCMLLVDFNNLMFRMLFVKDVGIKYEYPNFALWRYKVYDSIYQSIKYVGNVSEVILAVDDKSSWRRSYFSRYKESRKGKRDKSDVNWPKTFNIVNQFVGDLKHHMPFKVLKFQSTEADDIIAILALKSQKECIVISNDEDYLQLCSDRIKVFNPSDKKYMTCVDTDKFIIEKCLTGQAKDDIFNVRTPNDWGLTPETKGKKKPGLGKKTAEKIMADGYEKWLDENYLNEHFHRNKVLIDFNMIPQVIERRILTGYRQCNFPPPENMFPFFKKYQMKGYVEDFHSVEQTLMRLYR